MLKAVVVSGTYGPGKSGLKKPPSCNTRSRAFIFCAGLELAGELEIVATFGPGVVESDVEMTTHQYHSSKNYRNAARFWTWRVVKTLGVCARQTAGHRQKRDP
jgi:hypothetical protein